MIAVERMLLLYWSTPELQLVPVNEFARGKNNSIRLKSFNDSCAGYLNAYIIPHGKPGWFINGKDFIFYAVNPVIVLPGAKEYAEKAYPYTGSSCRLPRHVNIQQAVSRTARGTGSKATPYLPCEWAPVADANTSGVC